MSDFHDKLIATIPRMRLWARERTRDRTAAEDLVQETVLYALAGQRSFTPGSNFTGWIYRILHNRFLTGCRKRHRACRPDEVPESLLAVRAPYEDRLALQELRRALAALPIELRDALLMVAVQGMSYAAAAESIGCPLGTIKRRVHDARHMLVDWMMGDEDALAIRPGHALRRPADAPRPFAPPPRPAASVGMRATDALVR